MRCKDVVRAPEFWMCVLVASFVFPNGIVMNMNLDTVREDKGASAWSVAALLTLMMVLTCTGKIAAGMASDATIHTQSFQRSFWLFAVTLLSVLSFTALAFGPSQPWVLMLAIGAGGLARGASPLTTTITREVFGERELGLFLGLYSALFFIWFCAFSYLYVEMRSSPGAYWAIAATVAAASSAICLYVWGHDTGRQTTSRVVKSADGGSGAPP